MQNPFKSKYFICPCGKIEKIYKNKKEHMKNVHYKAFEIYLNLTEKMAKFSKLDLSKVEGFLPKRDLPMHEVLTQDDGTFPLGSQEMQRNRIIELLKLMDEIKFHYIRFNHYDRWLKY